MSDIENIVEGLKILRQCDDTDGDVSIGYEGIIYAGPESEENLARLETFRSRLEQLGWDDDHGYGVGRWGYGG